MSNDDYSYVSGEDLISRIRAGVLPLLHEARRYRAALIQIADNPACPCEKAIVLAVPSMDAPLVLLQGWIDEAIEELGSVQVAPPEGSPLYLEWHARWHSEMPEVEPVLDTLNHRPHLHPIVYIGEEKNLSAHLHSCARVRAHVALGRKVYKLPPILPEAQDATT